MNQLLKSQFNVLFYQYLTTDQLLIYIKDMESRMHVCAETYIRSDDTGYKEEYNEYESLKNWARKAYDERC
jgi:hypothetical protein